MTRTSTHATTHRPAPAAPRPSITVDPTTEAPSTRTLTVLVTSMASVAGMWGGAHAGLGVSDEYGSGWGDELVGAMVGAGLGSNLGAITTAGLIQGNWGSTILGSLGGSALGVVVGVMVGEGVRSSGLGVAAYALTHGLTTTLAGGR